MNRYHRNALDHGWWIDCEGYERGVLNRESVKNKIPEKLALIHSEVSEALEDYRNGDMALGFLDSDGADAGKPYGLPSELADIVIRVYDLAGALGIDLDAAIEVKHQYNVGRPYRHGGKRC